MDSSNKTKKKESNLEDLVTTQVKQIEELEKRLSKLERKKPTLKTITKNIKSFVLKHKIPFIIILSLFLLITLWEGYSLYAYKEASDIALSAQEQNNFEKAEEELLKMQEITNRSLILFLLRKDSVQNRISYNEEWKRSYDNTLISTTELVEEEKATPSKSEQEPIPPQPEPEPISTETYDYHEYYPIILSLSDNKGNIIKRSNFNGYSGFDKYMWNTTNTTLKIGDQINLSVEASDPEGRQLFYNFNSNSTRFNEQHGISEGLHKWTTSNSVSHTITLEDLQSAGETLTIIAQIKSEKTNLRFGEMWDDLIFLDYTLSPN
jgi:hypothetical protein